MHMNRNSCMVITKVPSFRGILSQGRIRCRATYSALPFLDKGQVQLEEALLDQLINFKSPTRHKRLVNPEKLDTFSYSFIFT